MTQTPLPPPGAAHPPVPAAEAVAEFVAVSKRYGEVLAADRLSLRIRRGEFLSFLGPSGCGKTTALRMLAGFESPSDGHVLIDGQEVNGLAAHRRPVNMVFQHYALFPHMSVAGNVGYGLRQRRPRLPRAEIAAKVTRALATVRLESFADRRIWELSGGQQQRVALARAIVNEPRILLLDEPMAALDAKLRGEMQRELLELQRGLGITFVLVTHDQEEAMAMSDRICLMGRGRIAQIGSPRDLYDRPSNRYVADFIGRANILPAHVLSRQGGQARVALATGAEIVVGDPGGALNGDVELAVRPEALSLALPGQAGAVLEAVVRHRTFLGDHTEYQLDGGPLGPLQLMLPRQAEARAGSPEPGQTVRVHWPEGTGLILGADD